MSPRLEILSVGPGVSVQDLGRPGHLAQGLSPGGAADRLALYEAAVLLGQSAPRAALEMAGMGGRFRASTPTRIALTGAPMRASLDGQSLRWNAAHLLPAGAVLDIGPAESGTYGYLAFAGGLGTPAILGAQGTHLAAGLGQRCVPGEHLPLGPDPDPGARLCKIAPTPRCQGGTLRVMPGPQSALFSEATRARFFATAFTAARANRQGVTLAHDGAAFTTQPIEGLVSDLITAGDIQMTGAGVPMVLLSECQTIGGYARLGTVLPIDLPILAQATPGTVLRFRPVSLAEAELASPPETHWPAAIRRGLSPLVRAPQDIPDLLSYQLVSGMIRGDEEEP